MKEMSGRFKSTAIGVGERESLIGKNGNGDKTDT